MLNITIPGVTGTVIPVKIAGYDTGNCEIVLNYPTNSHRYAMFSSNKAEGLNTIFLECVSEIRNPFKINDVDIVPEDLIKHRILGDAFDECILWIMKSLGEPEKN